VNQAYIQPLAPLWAANPHGPAEYQSAHVRLGPLGDPMKVNCTTCHQGANRPLLGAQMLRDYPELTLVTDGPIRAVVPGRPDAPVPVATPNVMFPRPAVSAR
jgi:photosynthetic reaction center cytochrome c subunit